MYLLAIHLEQALRETGERVLVVEPSGLPNFAYHRDFYRWCGYEKEARIRDFYSVGNDKVIFHKLLTTLPDQKSAHVSTT